MRRFFFKSCSSSTKKDLLVRTVLSCLVASQGLPLATPSKTTTEIGKGKERKEKVTHTSHGRRPLAYFRDCRRGLHVSRRVPLYHPALLEW